MTKTFETQIQIKFHHADPAGIMYFAHIFSLAHDAFGNLVQAAGFSWDEFFLSGQIKALIKQEEYDYKRLHSSDYIQKNWRSDVDKK